MSALGFSRHQISAMISAENIELSALATAVNLAILGFSTLVSSLFSLPFIVSTAQIVLSVAATFAIVMLLSMLASYKLVRTEPAVALRK